jgi:hypothetical protein
MADPVSDRDCADSGLINAAREVRSESPCFGYRLVAGELRADSFVGSGRRVLRLCSQEGLFSLAYRRKCHEKQADPGPAVHDELVQREFNADASTRCG